MRQHACHHSCNLYQAEDKRAFTRRKTCETADSWCRAAHISGATISSQSEFCRKQHADPMPKPMPTQENNRQLHDGLPKPQNPRPPVGGKFTQTAQRNPPAAREIGRRASSPMSFGELTKENSYE